jgi:hypothetical protein
LEVFLDRTSLIVGRVIDVAEDTPYSTRAFLTWALASRVVTSAFNASGLEVTKIFGVPITLTVGTLRAWAVRIGFYIIAGIPLERWPCYLGQVRDK